MADHITEEQQIEALKRWWKDYGTTAMIALAVIVALFIGWSQYNAYKARKANAASTAYQNLLAAQPEEQAALTDTLIEDYSGTLYADFAKLRAAKQAVEAEDLERAAELLRGVSDNAANAELQTLARLRLARVLAAQGQIEPALTLLDAEVPIAFSAAYAETRGDVLMGADRLPEARTAYETALTALQDPRSLRRNLVQLKIDNTRTAADSPVPVAEPVEES